MDQSMTYVIGAGGTGIEVIDKLHQRREQEEETLEAPGLMAIDSDGDRLAELPPDVPTIHLTSDDGLVSDYASMYPFLPSDVAIPADDANCRRHIGRYKFDNGASPEYENYYEEVEAVLQRFFADRSTALSRAAQREVYRVLLVTSLGGGTGSGIFPLLSTIINHVVDGFEELDLRISVIGVVPPLDVDLKRGSPPAEPATYPNTYAALRNLATLFDADKQDPLQLPVYSTVDPTAFDGTINPRDVVDNHGTVFELATPPFDEFWLVSTASGPDETSGLRDGMEQAISTIVGAVDALDSRENGVSGQLASSNSRHTPSFGTLGYATLRVPHKKVRAYCQRKQDLEALETRLNRARSQSEALREERDRLTSALHTHSDETAAASSDWINRVCHRLGYPSGGGCDFLVETTESEFKDTLEAMSEEYRTGPYLELLSHLEQAFTDGEIQQSVESYLEQTYRSVRSNYDTDFLSNDTLLEGPLDSKLQQLERWLTEQIEVCQSRLDQTEQGVRDIFPPVHDLLTSPQERFETRLERLRSDRNRVSKARNMLASFQAQRSAIERRLTDMRSTVYTRLEELETELARVKQRRDNIRDDLSACEAELASYHQSLTEPHDTGPEFVLPLDYDGLAQLTLDEVEGEYTSLTAYRDQGMLSLDRMELVEYLQQCIDYSRNWPDGIVEHDPKKIVSTQQLETKILSSQQNRSLISNLSPSNSVSDEVSIISDRGTHSFSIHAVSTARKGRPDSLVSYQWLAKQADNGVFDAYNIYEDQQLAITYPEWYPSDNSEILD